MAPNDSYRVSLLPNHYPQTVSIKWLQEPEQCYIYSGQHEGEYFKLYKGSKSREYLLWAATMVETGSP